MKYEIEHTTQYDYDAPVPVCHNIVYLMPRNTRFQTRLDYRLAVAPEPEQITTRTDYFGNTAQLYSISASHRQLRITASSTVDVTPRELPSPSCTPPWESVCAKVVADQSAGGLENRQFAFPSCHVPFHRDLAQYARESFVPNRPILDALSHLNTRIHTDIVYDPKATTVSTPISEVFRLRRGVCQDLSHMMLGCLRPLGIAARYVSGYLRTTPAEGMPRLVGADASHAWVSVFCGDAGWVDVDPTNDTFALADHITVAWGRDFSDLCPVTGMFVGGAKHQVSVAVDVAVAE